MNKRFFVIGDIEMGGGDVMDDFHDDDALVKFIRYVGNGDEAVGAGAGRPDEEVVLILNGDTFDFLKMDYKGKYPRYITEEISMWKLERVMKAHPGVFKALADFASIPKRRLIFVIGNHDADLAWPQLQQKILHALGAASGHGTKVEFTHAYEDEHFHVQHGNIIDPVFGFDYATPIIEHKGKKILNLPLGAHISMQYLTPFKRKFHKEEALYPQHEVLEKFPEYKKELGKLMRRRLPKIFLFDPILHPGDPMYRVPYGRILRHLLRHGFDRVHDDRFLDIEELDTLFGRKQVYVLSHAHVLKDRMHKGGRYLFVDCWRTELNVLSQDLAGKPKTYVEIAVKGDTLASADLKVFEV